MRDPMGIPHELVQHDRVEHTLILASKFMAVSGGILFIVLIIMSLVSIIGRKLGLGPVNGDIELMQVGSAVAVTAFLPYCTLLGEHIKVDFFTEGMRNSLKRPIDGIAEILFAIVSAVLVWRTTLAAIATHESEEVTTLVSLPLWIPTALLIPGLVLMTLCALYRAYAHFNPNKSIPGATE